MYLYMASSQLSKLLPWVKRKSREWNGLSYPLAKNLRTRPLTLSAPYRETYSHDLFPYISLKNLLREIDKRSKHFPFDDHFDDSHNLSLVDVSILLAKNKCWSWGFHLPLLVLMSDVNKHFDKRCHGRTRLCKFLGRKHFCLKRNEPNFNFYWFCLLLLFLPFFFFNRSQVPVVIFLFARYKSNIHLTSGKLGTWKSQYLLTFLQTGS